MRCNFIFKQFRILVGMLFGLTDMFRFILEMIFEVVSDLFFFSFLFLLSFALGFSCNKKTDVKLLLSKFLIAGLHLKILIKTTSKLCQKDYNKDKKSLEKRERFAVKGNKTVTSYWQKLSSHSEKVRPLWFNSLPVFVSGLRWLNLCHSKLFI